MLFTLPVTNCHTFSDLLPPRAWRTLWTAPKVNCAVVIVNCKLVTKLKTHKLWRKHITFPKQRGNEEITSQWLKKVIRNLGGWNMNVFSDSWVGWRKRICVLCSYKFCLKYALLITYAPQHLFSVGSLMELWSSNWSSGTSGVFRMVDMERCPPPSRRQLILFRM